MGILDTQCVYNLIGRLNYSKTKIDDALSETSVNAVQNKVLTPIIEALQADSVKTITEAVELKDLEEGVYQVIGEGEIWLCSLDTPFEDQVRLTKGCLVWEPPYFSALGNFVVGYDTVPDLYAGAYFLYDGYTFYSLFQTLNRKQDISNLTPYMDVEDPNHLYPNVKAVKDYVLSVIDNMLSATS